ncbi:MULTISPECIES: hypothetical protein [unclassified Leisingera]|uniref:hypothetical protein n=1 Tax=unclassified Leisingera TaxID=2614906 RepID=UPI00031F5A0C|nr:MULTISPECIES: hypothetical protein [unclassified Leisingera]KIC16500.1 hypothetical protein RA21_12760 [Leisingera sp. ANG-DT]KIC24657.1 hypothetical protein RA23_08890 [Leisingera sp. ANG-S3]KIC28561.1 hypothetical protein RA24_11665 [Leisingera sp. ANG-M6]KIC31688.1 hypothetical protein RA25_16425 [Leisingera sp. ANG-S5]KIC55487.1 hypothetical protein RA22_01720 [Leisingera sp. ANG-S]
MPHAELKFSSDLDLDAEAILAEIEAVILEHDGGAGACKGRAYPTDRYHHTHITVSVALLTKPHRDEAFSKALLADLESRIKARLLQPCEFSLGLSYSTPFYVTNFHAG